MPRFKLFSSSLDRLLLSKSEHIKSIVLFGSMAKGTHDASSDYDIFVVVSDNERRDLMDRLEEYSAIAGAGLQPFVYNESELSKMFEDFHPLLLDSLRDGIVLYDVGIWKNLRRRFQKLVRNGTLTPVRDGWDIKNQRISDQSRP